MSSEAAQTRYTGLSIRLLRLVWEKEALHKDLTEGISELGSDPYNLLNVYHEVFGQTAEITTPASDAWEEPAEAPEEPAPKLLPLPDDFKDPPEGYVSVKLPDNGATESAEKKARQTRRRTKANRDYGRPVGEIIKDFFEDNPGQWISRPELSELLDIDSGTLSVKLSFMVKSGFLTRATYTTLTTGKDSRVRGGRKALWARLPRSLPSEEESMVLADESTSIKGLKDLSQELYSPANSYPLDDRGVPIMPLEESGLRREGITIRPGETLDADALEALRILRGFRPADD